MKNYFKGTVKFQEDGSDKPTMKNYMVDAVSFAEAELHLSQYMIEFEDVQDFFIKTMTRVSFDDILFLKDMEEFDWYISTVKVDMGDDKEATFKYLVAGESMRDVTSQLTKWLKKDSIGDFRIPKVAEEPLGDIVLAKNCEIMGTMILSFLDQRSIDIKMERFREIQELNERVQKELGAVRITARKYTLEVEDKTEFWKRIVGKTLGQRVVKEWREDFIDKDSGEVASIERKEVVVGVRTYIDDEVLQVIKDAMPETITLLREDL
jgi:hypothetical protein